MASLAEILVVVGSEVRQRLPLANGPIHVGRSHTNDLVLSDSRVSSHHAVLWVEGATVMIEDMGSRNGTLVNGERCSGRRALADGDEIAIGATTILRVSGVAGAVAPGLPVARMPVLEDLEGGLRFPLWSDRFHVGSAADADLRLDDAPPRLATLLVYDGCEVWLGREDDDEPLETGAEFVLGGRRYRIGEMDAGAGPTTGMDNERYPYRITATLNGASGPEAEVEHLQLRPKYRVEADTRAVLLYLLARKVQEDRDRQLPGLEQGWCTDQEVATGVWGRARSANDSNSLNVLVHRVRKELVTVGFEPWFIEKRRRRIRVRVADVAIE